MSKTPEEMAEEYTRDWWGGLPEAEGMRKSARENFLAGYKAANERALRLVDEVQERLSGAYDNGEFMESEWDYIVMAFDTISTAIRGLK
jgi:hypothetical protein